MSFTGKSPHLEGASDLFQQDCVPDYLLDLISRAAPSPLHSDPIFISPSFLCALWVEFFLGFFFWGMVRLMRCGSDTESALLLLISTEPEGREGGRQAAGLRALEKKLRDDERGGKLQTLFRTLVLKVLQYRWFEISPQITYIAGITVNLLSKAFQIDFLPLHSVVGMQRLQDWRLWYLCEILWLRGSTTEKKKKGSNAEINR